AKRAERSRHELSGRSLSPRTTSAKASSRTSRQHYQRIAALGLNPEIVRGLADKLDEPGRRALAESQSLAEDCIRELRRFSYLLHPPMLQDRGAEVCSEHLRGWLCAAEPHYRCSSLSS